ncbi:menaquinone-dependent protoporphyrinogen IX dehydrogenase [Cohaesibacter celericrescens]|uniref:menaquinone-dependent protoporphyrinogen IX dehydrogenase n=1 Tax=Cohaesibacter celericrescens TaxID=2067669 RepID=UPI003566CC01
MPKITIVFASQDGQTASIARQIALHLVNYTIEVEVIDLAAGPPDGAVLDESDVVVVAAAIRYGHPLATAERFLSCNAARLVQMPLVMLSINLTARKPDKRSYETSVYLRKWVQRHKLAPVLTASIAGKLDYPNYRWFDRVMIQLIMRMTEGPTDPTTCIEFTDWQQVNDLADEIATLV